MSSTIDFDDDTSGAIAEPRQTPELGESVSPGTRGARMLSKEETARLGDEIYERDIRPRVEGERHGDYVAIDVDSGGWAVADELLAAASSLRAEHPDAVNVWLVRVGYRAVQHFGGRPYRRVS